MCDIEAWEVWENPKYTEFKNSNVVKELDEINEIRFTLITLIKISYGVESYNQRVVNDSLRKLEEFTKLEG